MFLYIEFVCDNIRLSGATIVLPDINVAVTSLHESATNLTFMEVAYETIGNPTSCPALYLTGVRFRGDLQHVGHVGGQKINCRYIRTREKCCKIAR